MKTINIAIVDDHCAITEGMELIINSRDNMNMIFTANSSEELFQKMKTNTKSLDILLLDIKMPVVDGFEVMEKWKKEYPKCKLVFLSYHTEPQVILNAFENGAAGYIQKNWKSDEIIFSIQKVVQNGQYFNEKIQGYISDYISKGYKAKIDSDILGIIITKQEKKILKLICAQQSTNEIADLLSINFKTVEAHRYNLMKKTGSANLAGLVIFAIKRGLYIVEKQA